MHDSNDWTGDHTHTLPLQVPSLPEDRLEARILLAEDGPDNQRLITAFLERAGAEVHCVENGRLALDRTWQAVLENRPFQLVLMDMYMPEMDGFEATRELRRRGYPGLIVAVTALSETSDREACFQAGCNEFTSKPVDRRAFIALLRRLLDNRTAMAG